MNERRLQSTACAGYFTQWSSGRVGRIEFCEWSTACAHAAGKSAWLWAFVPMFEGEDKPFTWADLQGLIAAASADTPTWKGTIWPWAILPVVYQVCVDTVVFLLRPVYAIAITQSHSFRKFIYSFVGTSDVNALYPALFVMLGFGQLIASLLEVAFFVVSTNWMHTHTAVERMEKVLAVYMLFHRLVLLTKNDMTNNQGLFTTKNLVELFTVPQMLCSARCGWLTLGFLQAHRAHQTYEGLEYLNSIGVIHFYSSASDITRAFILAGLSFIKVTLVYAGLVFVLEVLGEVPFVAQTFTDTAMGDLSFFTMVYWVLETMSTVGYGDYAPKTLFSRVVTMCCMVTGVVLFAVATSKIVELLALQTKGTGRFHKDSKGGHVVLMGSGAQQLDEGLLIAFFSELYHLSYKSIWPETVMLVCSEQAVKRLHRFINTSLDLQCRHLITVLLGSPLAYQDLERCQCDTAELVYILADSSCQDGGTEGEQDKRNIIRAMNVRHSFPKTKVRLLLMETESKALALSAGISPSRCCAVNEFKANLFWHSSRCIGWSTLLSNLVVTTDDKEFDEIRMGGAAEIKTSAWREEYCQGMSLEVYGFEPDERFLGRSYRDLVDEAYTTDNIIVFAAQVDGSVVIAPFKTIHAIQPGNVFFALAEDASALGNISRNPERKTASAMRRNRSMDFGKDWHADGRRPSDASRRQREGSRRHSDRRPSGGRRPLSLTREEPGHRSPRQSVNNDNQGYSVLQDALPRVLIDGSTAEGSFEYASYASMPPLRQKMSSSSKIRANLGAGGAGASLSLSSRNQLKAQASMQRSILSLQNARGVGDSGQPADPADLAALEERAAAIRRNHTNKPFIIFLELSTSWRRVGSVIVQFRSQWLPHRVPLVILCSAPPSRTLLEQFDIMNDPFTGIVLGSPKWVPDLLKAGVEDASVILCPSLQVVYSQGGEGTINTEELAMIDSDSIVLYQMLDGLGITNRTMILFELKRVINLRLMSQVEAGALTEEDELEFAPTDTPLTISGHARHAFRYIANMVMEPMPQKSSFALRLCGNTRFISGQVFMPTVLGALLAREYFAQGIIQVVQALLKPEEERDVFVWQIIARGSMVGKPYADCWHDLLRDDDGPALALGLYRFTDEEDLDELNAPRGYVVTNPPQETEIGISDLIFVLASAAWGRRMYNLGLLPNTAEPNGSTASDSDDGEPMSAPADSAGTNMVGSD